MKPRVYCKKNAQSKPRGIFEISLWKGLDFSDHGINLILSDQSYKLAQDEYFYTRSAWDQEQLFHLKNLSNNISINISIYFPVFSKLFVLLSWDILKSSLFNITG